LEEKNYLIQNNKKLNKMLKKEQFKQTNKNTPFYKTFDFESTTTTNSRVMIQISSQK
jgi:hypothetical protein